MSLVVKMVFAVVMVMAGIMVMIVRAPMIVRVLVSVAMAIGTSVLAIVVSVVVSEFLVGLGASEMPLPSVVPAPIGVVTAPW